MEKKQTKAVAKKPKKKLVWADFSRLLSPAKNDKEKKEQQMILAYSVAYNMPPMGINILGDRFYANKEGLTYKLDQYYGNEIKKIKKELIEAAKQPTDTAVAKTTIILKDGRSFEEIGTANQKNVTRIATDYINEMAITRSYNRCVWQMVAAKMDKEFIRRVNYLISHGRHKDIKLLTGSLESVSYEEMPNRNNKEEDIYPTEDEIVDIKDSDLVKIKGYVEELNAIEKLPLKERKERLSKMKVKLTKIKSTLSASQIGYLSVIFNRIKRKNEREETRQKTAF